MTVRLAANGTPCRDKMQARSRAIKVLDYAMSGPAGTAACETFVDALGLKTLFSSFMGKVPEFQHLSLRDIHDYICIRQAGSKKQMWGTQLPKIHHILSALFPHCCRILLQTLPRGYVCWPNSSRTTMKNPKSCLRSETQHRLGSKPWRRRLKTRRR